MSAITAEREADHVGLHGLERTDFTSIIDRRYAERILPRLARHLDRARDAVLRAEQCRSRVGRVWIDVLGRVRHGDAEAFDMRGNLRELVDGQLALVRKHDRAKNRILELTNVAGPSVADQHVHGIAADRGDPLAFFGGEPRKEVAHQLRHVADTLAQRGHDHGEDIQAIVQILAELAFLDELDHVAVRRRDQAEVDLDALLRADGIDLAFLKRTQQLDLRIERELADLVEEERAAVGLLELTDALVDGAGERALLMAEENALDEVLGDRAAVDGDERPAGALALALDGARDQFLADAGFAFDQDGDVGGCGTAAEGDDLVHDVAAHDEIVEGQRAFDFLLDARDLTLQGLDLECALYRYVEPLLARGLHDEVGGPCAHGADGGLDGAVGGLHDDWGRAGLGADALEHGHAVGAGHDEIEQDDGDGRAFRAFEDLEGVFSALGGADVVAQPLDHLFKDAALGRIVIDDEDALGHEGILTQQNTGHVGRSGGSFAGRAPISNSSSDAAYSRGRECPSGVNGSLRNDRF